MRLIKCFCAVAVLFLTVGCSGTQLYYVKKARIVASSEENHEETYVKNRPESAKLLLNGHYVKTGDCLVLLFRKFNKGHLFTVDDETYEKLTIEIKNFTVGKSIGIDSHNVRFFYSSGSSSFLSKGHGVYSTSGAGNIVISKIEKNRITVELNLELWAKPAGPFPFEGRKVKLMGSFSFKEKQLVDLSPWLGVPDASMGKEVYP